MTRIDRRALFATGSAAALLAAAGVSAEPLPKRGGHLRVALSGGARSEGWNTIPGGRFLQAARNAVFESLTEIAADGTLQPCLATEWTSSEQGKVWRFSLASDVEFHDGTVFGVDDALASLVFAGFDARKDGSNLVIHLDAPNTAFPFDLARGGIAVFSAKELKSGSVRSGTGMYTMQRFDQGRGFYGTRVARHRKDGVAGWFESVELVAVADTAARFDAVRDGYVDAADLSEAVDLGGRHDLRLLTDATGHCTVMRSDVRTQAQVGQAPLDDMRFVERWWIAT